MAMDIEWRAIPEFPHYEINRLEDVRLKDDGCRVNPMEGGRQKSFNLRTEDGVLKRMSSRYLYDKAFEGKI